MLPHPFSGSSKAGGRPVYFEKAASDRHSLAVSPPLDHESVSFPPDEERGRKFKPSVSAPALFTVTIVDCVRSTFGPELSLPFDGSEGEEWLPGHADDDDEDTTDPGKSSRESAAYQVQRDEAARQRRLWSSALQKALDEGKAQTDIELM